MIFIDTDIFVIDKLFPKDDRYEINKAFLNEAEEKLPRYLIYLNCLV